MDAAVTDVSHGGRTAILDIIPAFHNKCKNQCGSHNKTSSIAASPRPEGDLPGPTQASGHLVVPNAPEDGARSETGA